LTFERSLWVATAVAAAFVIVRAEPTHRLRAVMVGTASLLVVLAAIGTLAPNELSTARERLFSLSQYGTDSSVRYRVAESNHVGHEIRAKPLIGSGLGASIFWGQPWDQVPPSEETYAHNGYLWLAWKVGIPTAALLGAVLFWSLGLSKRTKGGDVFEAVQNGSRAGILALALVAVTLSVVNELGITASMGMLFAMALWPTEPDPGPLSLREP
jgi:O-antigen ligase